MSHSDDDGLVLPPKLAPAHVVVLPMYRNEEERGQVLPYCESLQAELKAQTYNGEAVRVRIDDRDLRGGEKKWQWIKRGVPLLAEIGPRDVAGEGAFVARRDTGPKGRPFPRAEFVATIATQLAELQQVIYDRAIAARQEATRQIDRWDEFVEFFTPKHRELPEIHGGLAYAYFVDGPEMEARLKELKVTARCVPLERDDEPGVCIFTGQPSDRRAVFAKAY